MSRGPHLVDSGLYLLADRLRVQPVQHRQGGAPPQVDAIDHIREALYVLKDLLDPLSHPVRVTALGGVGVDMLRQVGDVDSLWVRLREVAEVLRDHVLLGVQPTGHESLAASAGEVRSTSARRAP